MNGDAIELVREWAADLFGVGACITDIEASPSSSTHPSFTVTASSPKGLVEALCKCQFGVATTSFGHRRGVRYEAAVYQRLAGAYAEMPRLIGCRSDTAAAVLAVEYISDATPLKELADGARIVIDVAEWLGALQRDFTNDVDVVRHPPDYYVGWAQRAAVFATAAGGLRPFIDACRHCEPLLESLASLDHTLLHGELTPGNVLVSGSGFHVVDWESAALGPGEIDFVAITHKWPQETQRAALAAYVAARWDGAAPERLERRVDLARLYWDLRWLGDRPDWWKQARLRERIPAVLATIERLHTDEMAK